jgi:hypothetical protein
MLNKHLGLMMKLFNSPFDYIFIWKPKLLTLQTNFYLFIKFWINCSKLT